MKIELTLAVISLLMASNRLQHVQAKHSLRAARAEGALKDNSALNEESFTAPSQWMADFNLSMDTSDGTCDGGNIGNGICANGECCSPFGWCGMGPEYCVGTEGITTTPPTVFETSPLENSGFSLVLTNDEDIDPSILASITSAFFSYYPHIVDVYSPDATKKVFLLVNNQTDGNPAWAVGDEVTLRGPYLKDIPLDTAGVTVHEITHVAQKAWKNIPGYFIEGFADFIRDETGVDQAMGNSWSLPECYDRGWYTDGYGVTAAFVKWMLANNMFVLEDLISVFRDGTYSDESTWPALTGTGLDDLWGLYMNSTACLPV